jgi:phage shock protein PspC (stress-responsive transcriptional regulator)
MTPGSLWQSMIEPSGELMNEAIDTSGKGRMLAGVCTGLGRYLGIDTTIVRIIFVLLALFAMGGVLLYLILWLIMPMETA